MNIKRAYFEAAALDYDLGRELHSRLSRLLPEVAVLPARGRVPGGGVSRADPAAAYRHAKQTLVVAVRRNLTFQKCRPSADWQLPLVTSCPGLCAYCYLQTTLGARPYIRVYVNVDEILARVDEYAAAAKVAATAKAAGQDAQNGRVTTFEAAATGDPIAVETLTGALSRVVTAFGSKNNALLRVVTKFAAVGPLLELEHNGRTRLRFSINTPYVVAKWEHCTAPVDARLEAAASVARAGYPLGLMIAPLIIYPRWREDYEQLLESAASRLAAAAGAGEGSAGGSAGIKPGADGKGLTFEVVTHRFTARARDLILSRHAGAGLPMDEEGRRYRMGQFGYGKWVYPSGEMDEVKEFMSTHISRYFPEATLEYVV